MTLTDLFSFLNKLGGASFATLLAVILFASWKKIWRWGSDLAEIEARYAADLVRERDEKNWWRAIGLKALGVAEVQGRVLHVKEQKAADAITDLNKDLLPPG